MKKTHITKAIALVMTVMMLIGCVPMSVLPVFAADDSAQSSSVFDDVKLGGKDYATNAGLDNANEGASGPGTAWTKISKEYSPYEPYSTNDENHPFLSTGAAWIDLSKIYYGAPATPNYPLTKWSANTSVYNVTGTGEKYECGCTDTSRNGNCATHHADGEEIYSLPDLNLIDQYLWVNSEAKITSVTNKNGGTVEKWQNGVAYVNDPGRNDSKTNAGLNAVTPKTDGTAAFVYNRYDAMQGKWGLTLDKNVKSVMWSPSYKADYYGEAIKNENNLVAEHYYASDLYLTQTPYLYFSTEAVDTAQISISLLIGAPVQSETIKSASTGETTAKHDGRYEYRWYTITDNALRPGIDEKTQDYSMTPNVYKSGVVLQDIANRQGMQMSDDVMNALVTAGKTDPIAVATSEGVKEDTLFVSGAITGCIDFTNLLPMVMGSDDASISSSVKHHGSKDVKYKVAQICVTTKTNTNQANAPREVVQDSAIRLNYLYFGPALSTVYTPQNIVGNDVNAANWMYGQNDDRIGDEDPNRVAAFNTGNWDAGYTNGWENGQAVSVINTPNNPQTMIIDTYGSGNGQLITYEDYKTDPDKYKFSANNNAAFTAAAQNYGANKNDRYLNSRIWKYTGTDGVPQYLEAEYNEQDGNYYIMVTVPVRKWIDVLGNSRKLSYTLTMEQYGTQKDEKGKLLTPSFGLWGNNAGNVGAGHGGWHLTTRYRHEDIMAMFGAADATNFYLVDNADNFIVAEVDRTTADSAIYNDPGESVESWFDLLRSPYMLSNTVSGANKQYYYGDEMVGYSFVTAIRFAVPIGAKFTVQNMKGDGNSAGLNMYSTSGSIVSAYDGGTGAQPNINVTSKLPEKQAAVSGSNGNYTYTTTQTSSTGISGSQTNAAAAYGPHLDTSYYTIYDLLDTEKLNGAGIDAHAQYKEGLQTQKVYGKVYQNQKSIDFPILVYPTKNIKTALPSSTTSTLYTTLVSLRDTYGFTIGGWNEVLGYTYGAGTDVTVYSVVYFKDTKQYWGVVGVLQSGGTASTGWLLLREGSTEYFKTGGAEYGYLYNGDNTLESANQYKEFSSYSAFETTAHYGSSKGGDGYIAYVLAGLKNEWFYSNVGGASAGHYTDFHDATITNVSSHAGQPTKYSDIISNGAIRLSFANEWSQQYNTGGYAQMPAFDIQATNGTDMQIRMNDPTGGKSGNFSISMTRIFDNPIKLEANKYSGAYDYPALYYDFSASDFSGNQSNSFGIIVKVVYSSADQNPNGTGRYPAEFWWLGNDGLLKRQSAPADAGDGGLASDRSQHDVCGYVDLETMMNYYGWQTTDDKGNKVWNYPSIEIMGTNMYFYLADSLKDGNKSAYDFEVYMRRFEIWQVETDWLDEIHVQQHPSHETREFVADSMNIINDAFFNIHDETADGEYVFNIKKNSSGGRESYTISDTTDTKTYDGVMNSYRKGNSNKGWHAKIYYSGELETGDTYYSYNQTSVDGLFEYRSALGHLRVWVAPHKEASIVFNADRSFNVKNYRYLYYSYSVRDPQLGIGAEDNAGGTKTGVEVAIKEHPNGSDRAYVEQDGSWTFYPSTVTYWSDRGHDNRDYATNMCAAVDLSTFDKITSINQLVFYLNNDNDQQTEFYINYVYLSNVPPKGTIAEELQETQVQYYYMMDNTGDRYSARFPTIDNPTGQVIGTNSDNDRVNPIVVNRGARMSEGKYFNGDLIYGYGTTTDKGKLDQTTGSDGYYEKTYGVTDGLTDSMKNIMFYMGESNDLDDISDYYTYIDRGRNYTYYNDQGELVTVKTDPDGDANVYDMLWSYGRWFSEGSDGLNIMYIGEPGTEQYQQASFTANGVSGNLVRRYATENYVLLRSGIQPKTFTTYYDADGGEFLYENMKADTVENLQRLTENSYYITENVILSYFTQPKNIDIMKGEKGCDESKFLQKPGFKFDGWYHIDKETGDIDFEFYADANKENELDPERAKLQLYIRKQLAEVDYFKAKWVPLEPGDADYDKYYNADKTAKVFNATFNYGGTKLMGLKVGEVEDELNGRYAIKLPTASRMVNGVRTTIYGWTTTLEDGTTKTFAPGAKVYILEDTVFEAETEVLENMVHNITLEDAELYVLTQGENAIHEQPADAKFGITVLPNGNKTTYTNVPHGIRLVARPLQVITAGSENGNEVRGGWVEVADTNYETGSKELFYVTDTTSVILSDNANEYFFTSNRDIEVKYQDIGTLVKGDFYASQVGAFVSIVPNLADDALDEEKVHFTSQFDLPDGATFQAAGTLYTKNTYYNTFPNPDETMRLVANSVDEDTVALKTYTAVNSNVRYVQATKKSESNEFTMSVGRSTKRDDHYYARSYVIYTIGNEYYVAYSSVVAFDLAKKLQD